MRPVIEKLSTRKKTTPDSEVISFFFTLGNAAVAGNYEIIKKFWALPSYILSDLATTNLNSADELEKYFSAQKKNFTTTGVTTIRPEVLGQQWLTDQILVIALKWTHLDKNHHEIGEETALYNMKADKNGKLKIHILTQGLNKSFNLYF